MINSELAKIENWLRSNKLSLNHSKTKFMLVHSKRSHLAFNLYINNNKISQITSYEYLGVTIDDKLRWVNQIKYIETKLSQACGAISRIRPFVDQACLRALYFGHAYTYLQYAILAWGSTFDSNLQHIKVLQNRVLRMLALHGPLEGVELNNNELYANLNLLKLCDIHRLETAKFMHRCTNGTLPLSFESYFQVKNPNIRLRSLASNPFRMQIVHTEAYKRSLTNNGIRVWNSLDSEIKKLPYHPFKTKLKEEIIKSYSLTPN